ncbi:hypothetical protein SLOPH_706 [Spraguea lophii 42_110]|uniref:Ricin B lectin domain-containing protein n=1 Tax=Spraguea lophii (strain 42_110) TaxID=1358809 RepID=S7WCW3_SPRLO|nr:hypothetical protein SLOPH_706 [Spraguea lophii 42_110]
MLFYLFSLYFVFLHVKYLRCNKNIKELNYFVGKDINIFFSAYPHFRLAMRRENTDQQFVVSSKHLDNGVFFLDPNAWINKNDEGYEITVGNIKMCSRDNEVVVCNRSGNSVWNINRKGFGYTISQNGKCLSKLEGTALRMQPCTETNDQLMDFKLIIDFLCNKDNKPKKEEGGDILADRLKELISLAKSLSGLGSIYKNDKTLDLLLKLLGDKQNSGIKHLSSDLEIEPGLIDLENSTGYLLKNDENFKHTVIDLFAHRDENNDNKKNTKKDKNKEETARNNSDTGKTRPLSSNLESIQNKPFKNLETEQKNAENNLSKIKKFISKVRNAYKEKYTILNTDYDSLKNKNTVNPRKKSNEIQVHFHKPGSSPNLKFKKSRNNDTHKSVETKEEEKKNNRNDDTHKSVEINEEEKNKITKGKNQFDKILKKHKRLSLNIFK